MNALLRCSPIPLLVVSVHAAQKFDVKIVNRQDSETRYSYHVPASSPAKGSGLANPRLQAIQRNRDKRPSRWTDSNPTASNPQVVRRGEFKIALLP